MALTDTIKSGLKSEFRKSVFYGKIRLICERKVGGSEKVADYVMPVKPNRASLHTDITHLFAPIATQTPMMTRSHKNWVSQLKKDLTKPRTSFKIPAEK